MAQQLTLHNSLTPYEKANLDLQQQNASQAAHQQHFFNMLHLTEGFQNGTLKPATAGSPGAQVYDPQIAGASPVYFTGGTNEKGALDYLNLTGSGKYREVTAGDPDYDHSVVIGGRHIAAIPASDQAGMFTYIPTEEDRKNYPYLPARESRCPRRTSQHS